MVSGEGLTGVGSGSLKAAPVSAGGQLKLQPGQVLQAFVEQVMDKGAILQLQNQRLAVRTLVPLEPRTHVLLRFSGRNDQGEWVFQRAAPEENALQQVDGMLRELGMELSQRHQQIVQTLVALRLPVAQQPIRQMAGALRDVPDSVFPGALLEAAILQAAGMSVPQAAAQARHSLPLQPFLAAAEDLAPLLQLVDLEQPAAANQLADYAASRQDLTVPMRLLQLASQAQTAPLQPEAGAESQLQQSGDPSARPDTPPPAAAREASSPPMPPAAERETSGQPMPPAAEQPAPVGRDTLAAANQRPAAEANAGQPIEGEPPAEERAGTASQRPLAASRPAEPDGRPAVADAARPAPESDQTTEQSERAPERSVSQLLRPLLEHWLHERLGNLVGRQLGDDGLYLELPVIWQGELNRFRLRIAEEHEDSEGGAERGTAPAGYRFWLRIQTHRLGVVGAVVGVKEQQVTCQLIAEQSDTVRTLRQARPPLREWLAEAGLEMASFRVDAGVPPDPFRPAAHLKSQPVRSALRVDVRV